MADYSTPAHPPVQALHPPQALTAPNQAAPQPTIVPPAQPYYHPQNPAQYPYGYVQHPTPYGYHVPPHGEAKPAAKRPLEEEVDGPEPVKFGGVGRGRGRARVPGHLWGWQRIGFYEDTPTLPACHAHRTQACANCFTYVPVKK